MRAIEKKMLKAIELKQNFSLSNTLVKIDGNKAKVYLHGNLICVHNYETKERKFSSSGWESNTTKSRLNALGANVYQKNFVWYYRDGTEFRNEF